MKARDQIKTAERQDVGFSFSPEDIKTSYVENESHKTSSERWQKTSELPKWVRKSAQNQVGQKGD